MTAENVIELRHIGKSFAGVRALDDVTMTVRRSEIHCLAGENGSGKSTLIKIISGVYAPDQGEIFYLGEAVSHLTPKQSVRRGVQVIYQDFSLFGNLTVAENLALNTLLEERRRTFAWGQVRRLARNALDLLGVEIDLNAEIETLSTAQKQIVAIARALMSNATLIVMDEPTTALTGREVDTLFRIVRDIQGKGIAVLFVSHKMGEMLEISQRITVLRNGRKVAESLTSECTEASITRQMTGQEITTEPYAWSAPGDGAMPPRLEICDLSLPGAVYDVSTTIGAGEIVGISGLLGSGRTELALALFGLRPNYSGSILIDGRPATLTNVPDAIQCGIAYVPEDRLSEGLFLTQSVATNVVATILDRLSGSLFLDRSRANRLAAETVRAMQIATTGIDKPVGQLSGGNQQRVVIGRWLHTQARVLILNGPTVGVDVGSKAEIHRQIRELARGHGLSVLMISDDVPELVQNCNRILLMHRGRLVDDVQTSATSEDEVSGKLRSLR
jgi:simple sugar transport system ATP-binding protein